MSFVLGLYFFGWAFYCAWFKEPTIFNLVLAFIYFLLFVGMFYLGFKKRKAVSGPSSTQSS